MVYDPATREIVLFGGTAFGASLADTWTWDSHGWAAAAAPLPVAAPPPRHDADIVYDAATRQVVMFGGVGVGTFLGDTWTWDRNGWSQQMATHTARSGACWRWTISPKRWS